MNQTTPLRTLSTLLVLMLLAALPFSVAAQRREHLTPEEIEMVRDNQELDKRTSVFVKAAERRLRAAADPAAAAKLSDKSWGELKGTRAQFLSDLARILDEAVVNIDDANLHNPESPLLRKSLFKLSEAAARFLPQLLPLREAAQSEQERDQLERAIETAQEIVEAAKTHAVSEEDTKAKSKKKGDN
jgi:hypothetical protein